MKTIKNDIAKILMMAGIWISGRGLAIAPLWYDEAYSINMAWLKPWELIKISWADFNPSLYYFIIKPFVVWGSPWLARIPSLLASVMIMAIIWEMMDDWEVTENQRLMVAGLTLLPGFYWMAQDARIYAVLGLLYIMTFWLINGGQYVWAAITITLMIWGHSMGLILAISIAVVQLARDWMIQGMMGIREKIFNSSAAATILSVGVGIAAGFPALLPLTVGPGGISEFYHQPISWWYFVYAIKAALFVEVIQSSNPGYYLVSAVIWIYIILAVLITWLSFAGWAQILKTGDVVDKIEDDVIITSCLLVFVPLVIMLGISILIKNIIYYRPLMILLPPFILWLGSATAMKVYKPHKLIMPALLAASVIVLQLAWIPSLKGANLDQYTEMINQDPGNILYATGTAALPFDLYVDQPGWIAEADHHAALASMETLAAFGYEFREPGSWADWIIWPRDPLIGDELADQLDSLTAEMELVGVVEYWHTADIEIWHKGKQ